MSKSKIIGESDHPSSPSHRSTFDLPEYGKSIKRIRGSSSESSSSESHSKYDYKQQRKINDKEQTSNSLRIQSTSVEPVHTGESDIPRAKLPLLQTQSTEISNVEYQYMAWKTFKKNIKDRCAKVNRSNLLIIIREIFEDNIVRGRGLLASAIIQSQKASISNTPIYAALVSVINSKFPQIGELIIKRLISSFFEAYVDLDKKNCLETTTFIAHLINQNILHEIVALDILTLLLEKPYLSNDKIKLSVGFLKICGQKLFEVIPHGLNSIFLILTDLLNDLSLDQRKKSMIEVLFALREDEFKAYPSILTDLDLVDANDQYTHMVTVDYQCESEAILDLFKYDEQYHENEEKYKKILDEGGGNEYKSSGNSSRNDDENDQKKNNVNKEEQRVDDEEKEEKKIVIIDQTETDLITLRETIRSIIESCLSIDERAHELVQMNVRVAFEVESCKIIIGIIAQKRAYRDYYGYVAERCCKLRKEYIKPFEKIFQEQYKFAPRLESFKLRNLAKFFGYLLAGNSISWKILACIRLTVEETTSSSRFFLKNLFFELFKYNGLIKLIRRFNDPTLKVYLEGLFPHDTEKNTNFTINFYSSIGLGGLTDGLKKYLKRKRGPNLHFRIQEKEI